MKKIIIITVFSMYLGALSSAQEHFYYYFGTKIPLRQSDAKILVKFTPDAKLELLNLLIGSEATLKQTDISYLEENSPLRIAVLEVKQGKQIAAATLDFEL